jgi:hypothetical protein
MKSIADMYTELKTIARTFEDESITGNANYSAEAIQGDDVICYRQYSGGYESSLVSTQFGFVVWEKYTYKDGTTYRIQEGTEKEIQDCLDYCKRIRK